MIKIIGEKLKNIPWQDRPVTALAFAQVDELISYIKENSL